MSIDIINIILAFIFLLLIPVLVGNEMCHTFCCEKALSKSFVLGLIGLWSFCQIITVPFVLLKMDFRLVVCLLLVMSILVCVISIFQKRYVKLLLQTENVKQKIALIVMLLMIASLIFIETILQHVDADDSRFVVNAVDIVRTNKMFLTNPATGQSIDVWEGELIKDVTSPWAVYIAYLATVTGIHPTIMAHTILPIMLLLMVSAVYWLLSDVFFPSDIVYRCIFVCFAILVNIYGYYSLHSAETFLMTRIWQGKAVVAGIGIPLLILLFLWIYEERQNINSKIILLLIAEMAMCLLSGMGIIIGAIMAGCYGFVYGTAKKNWKLMLALWCCAIPNAVYYGISLFL